MISVASEGSGYVRWLANAIRMPSGDQAGIQMSTGPKVTWTWWLRSGLAVQISNWPSSSKRMKAMRPLGPGWVAAADAAVATRSARARTPGTMARRDRDVTGSLLVGGPGTRTPGALG